MSQVATHEARRIVPIDDNGEEMPTSAPLVPVQRVQTQYTTAIAVQKPRSLKEVERRVLEESALLGSDAYYGWGAGKDRVEGPSKDLAMMMVRCYGNCALDMGEVQETRDAWIFTAKFIDLETGFTMSRQFRQAKGWTVHGKFDAARKDDIRFQIGQSKAIRNVVLNALPSWLVNRGLDKAKGGVREAIDARIKEHGLDKVQAKYLALLAELGASNAVVLEAMGRANAAQLTPEDLVILAGNYAALKSGAETTETLFPLKPKEGEAPAGDPNKSKVENLAAELKLKQAAAKGENPPPPSTAEDAAKFTASLTQTEVPSELSTPSNSTEPAKPSFLEQNASGNSDKKPRKL